METYQEFKTRQQNEIDSLPIQWAFNNKQFADGMKSLGLDAENKEHRTQICTIPGGGFIRKTDVKDFGNTILRHAKELDELIASDKTGEGFILEMLSYELANHEYCVTYDIEPTLNAIGITAEDVAKNSALKHGLELAIRRQQ
jgi:hypothetical protein